MDGYPQNHFALIICPCAPLHFLSHSKMSAPFCGECAMRLRLLGKRGGHFGYGKWKGNLRPKWGKMNGHSNGRGPISGQQHFSRDQPPPSQIEWPIPFFAASRDFRAVGIQFTALLNSSSPFFLLPSFISFQWPSTRSLGFPFSLFILRFRAFCHAIGHFWGPNQTLVHWEIWSARF